jgi:hypothetical protein
LRASYSVTQAITFRTKIIFQFEKTELVKLNTQSKDYFENKKLKIKEQQKLSQTQKDNEVARSMIAEKKTLENVDRSVSKNLESNDVYTEDQNTIKGTNIFDNQELTLREIGQAPSDHNSFEVKNKSIENNSPQKAGCDWEQIKEETIPEEDNEKAVESYVLPKNKI